MSNERDSEEPQSGGSLSAPVSFASEELILVDSDDQIVGYRSKLDAHRGAGTLHRAFSAFLFDDQGRLLVHQRSMQKPLWPGYWTNSCCSHPRRGETVEAAVTRRLWEELGAAALSLTPVYHFEYQASFGDAGSEHELCHVYLTRSAKSAEIAPHAEEVMDWCWLSLDEVDTWMEQRSDVLTPWFKQEWQTLRHAHQDLLIDFSQAA
jgi:isopentenyl-diphosphate delta-isomerase